LLFVSVQDQAMVRGSTVGFCFTRSLDFIFALSKYSQIETFARDDSVETNGNGRIDFGGLKKQKRWMRKERKKERKKGRTMKYEEKKKETRKGRCEEKKKKMNHFFFVVYFVLLSHLPLSSSSLCSSSFVHVFRIFAFSLR
jgi:hypothetical protein